ncbi:Os03g0666550 [Oryza sativa Japonica Group]|uniref:Os03g0666550 protein n=1 Tax=Oryza sativa subsp. japonica TaxID=39947 RepID=A0A0P0W159_ORYSJ|nr:hypothetical protein EE612_019510 [Oryza sativa]BAS85642.1 Os03g0666550 [Oryza sativa Japonica Group]
MHVNFVRTIIASVQTTNKRLVLTRTIYPSKMYKGKLTNFIKYVIHICCSFRRCFHEEKPILLCICLCFLQKKEM